MKTVKEIKTFTLENETCTVEKGSGSAKFGDVSQSIDDFIAYRAEIEDEVRKLQEKIQKVNDIIKFME